MHARLVAGRRLVAQQRRPEPSDSGMVTAELAVAFIAVIAIVATVVGIAGVVIAQARCVDASYAAARASARGDAHDQAVKAGEDRAPDNAAIDIHVDGEVVRATVIARVGILGGLLPAMTVRSTSIADIEGTP